MQKVRAALAIEFRPRQTAQHLVSQLNFKYSALLSGILIALALLPAFALATAEVSITPRSLSACTCDPLYYDVSIYSDKDDVFNTQFTSDYAFSLFLQPQVPVPAFSSIKTTLVINSACDAKPGNYSFTVAARGQRGASSVEGYALIKSCRNLELSVPSQQSICSGGSQAVQITLANSGLVNEKGRLVFENLPASFYSLADDSFDLPPGKSRVFMLSLQPPSDTPPSSFTYTLRANNAIAAAGVEIQACNFIQPAKAEITPFSERVEFCAGTTKQVSFKLKNSGQSASFDLTATGVPGTLNPTSITVSQGATREFYFNIDAQALSPGNKTLTVSAFGPSSSDSASVSVRLKDCPNVVFGDLELCLGDSGSIPFSLKNSNSIAQQYSFTAFADIPVSVIPNSTTVGAGQAVSASLSVTGSALGVYPVQVYANATLLRVPKVIVKTCGAPSPTPSASPGVQSDGNYSGETGVLQEYSFDAGESLKNASIFIPGSLFEVKNSRISGTKLLFALIPLREGFYSVPALISANGKQVQKTFSFAVSSPAVEITVKSQATLSSENSTLRNKIVFAIANKGNAPAAGLIPSINVANASFDPQQLDLNAGESKDLQVTLEAQENQAVMLKLSASDKAYSFGTSVLRKPASSTTGFFTVARAVGLFTAIIVVVIILLAFVLKRQFESANAKGQETEEAEKSPGGDSAPKDSVNTSSNNSKQQRSRSRNSKQA